MNLANMTVPELKAKAKALGIPKADAMKKSDLIASIEQKEVSFSTEPMPPVSAVDLEGPIEGHPPKSSSMKTDFAKHPKFDKFKPVGEN